MIEFKQLHRHLCPLSPCSQWSFDMCWSSFRIKPTTFRPVLTTIDRRQAITNFSQPTCEPSEQAVDSINRPALARGSILCEPRLTPIG